MVRKNQRGINKLKVSHCKGSSLTWSEAPPTPHRTQRDPAMECCWPLGKADSLCTVGRLGFFGILLAAAPRCGMIALRRSKPSLGSREPSTEAVPGVRMMKMMTIANTDRMAPLHHVWVRAKCSPLFTLYRQGREAQRGKVPSPRSHSWTVPG